MTIRGERAIWEAETFGERMLEVTVGELLDQQAEGTFRQG